MISCIVPVYKAQRYLKRCIESVLSQSYTDLELIIVIDGTEGKEQKKCIDIARKYEKQDNRVIIVEQDNTGVDKARFKGLNIASGDFVYFVDADDWINKDAFGRMLEKMEGDDYDMVECSSYKCLGPIRQKRHLQISGKLERPELFDKYYISFFGWNILPVSIWGKLYRKSLIEQVALSPSGYAMGEDLVFNMTLFPFLRKIYLLDEPLYYYRYGGMTTRYNPHLLADLKSQFLLKLQLIDRYDYHIADNPVRIEMVNVLHSDIKQRIIYTKNCSRDRFINNIYLEITDPFWEEVLPVTNGYMDSSAFYIALFQKNAAAIYDLCKSEVNASRFHRLLGRIVSLPFSLIS